VRWHLQTKLILSGQSAARCVIRGNASSFTLSFALPCNSNHYHRALAHPRRCLQTHPCRFLGRGVKTAVPGGNLMNLTVPKEDRIVMLRNTKVTLPRSNEGDCTGRDRGKPH
jgi:hypothetical protein